LKFWIMNIYLKYDLNTSSFCKLSLTNIKDMIVSFAYLFVKYRRNFSELFESNFYPSGGRSLKWFLLFLINLKRSETLDVLYFLYLCNSESRTSSRLLDQSFLHLSSIFTSLPNFSRALTVGFEVWRNSRWSLRSIISLSFFSWSQNIIWVNTSFIGGLCS